DSEKQEQNLKSLQLKMLRIQQGVWHKKARAIIVFEGFDAAGKGGTIRRLVEDLDPRGFRVIPTGPPEGDDQQKHYLYRFWKNIPAPGTIAIFDRSWYGRVLVERVNKLVPKERWNAAFDEINQFEKLLADDGVEIIKIFLAISKAEQLTRFEQRLSDPYKNWKLTTADVEARKSWHNYVKAVDEIFEKTDSAFAPWNLIHADHKSYARDRSLRVVTKKMAKFGDWMEGKAAALERRTLKSALKELGLEKHTMNEFAAS
ncbi:MAG: polyphosphate kinase, partial [Proteobacteria bacterium]|nr:polyphosphate kinase [Pseudomonadota bacterium]